MPFLGNDYLNATERESHKIYCTFDVTQFYQIEFRWGELKRVKAKITPDRTNATFHATSTIITRINVDKWDSV